MRGSALVAGVLTALAFHSLAYAQDYATDKGSFLVGGSASFISSKTETGGVSANRITSIAIAPRVMILLARNFALGGEFILGHVKAGDQSATQYGIGPAVTYYFGQGDRPWYPYIGASGRFIHTGGNDDLGSDDRHLTVGGGLLFLLTRSVGINTELFYRASHSTFESPITLEEIDVNTNAFGLSIGISAFVF